MAWIKTIKIGDILVCVFSAFLLIWLASTTWHVAPNLPTRAVIRAQGKIVASINLPSYRKLTVQGLMGPTIIIIKNRQVKVAQDPGPKQYCVDQAWLSRNGDVGLCLPNQVSVQLLGAETPYDTLSY